MITSQLNYCRVKLFYACFVFYFINIKILVWLKRKAFWLKLKCNKYRKLVETFHNVTECKTDVYFYWWFSLQFKRPGDLDCWSFSVTSLMTDWELHLATETEQDQTRLSLLQYKIRGNQERNFFLIFYNLSTGFEQSSHSELIYPCRLSKNDLFFTNYFRKWC